MTNIPSGSVHDHPAYNQDEIDLFELAETLWHNRWRMVVITTICLVSGGLFVLLTKAEYQSRLVYQVMNLPPLYTEEAVQRDFQHLFYNPDIFYAWIENKHNPDVSFAELSHTYMADGFTLTKKATDRSVLFDQERKGDRFILIKSNRLTTLNALYEFAQFVNEKLTNRYLDSANKELQLFNKNLTQSDTGFGADTILLVTRYIYMNTRGAKTLAIGYPTAPEKVSPKVSLVMALSFILGLMISVCYVLFREALHKHRANHQRQAALTTKTVVGTTQRRAARIEMSGQA